MSTISTLRDYILNEFMPGSSAADLPDDLDLLNSGIIDSLGLLKIIAWVESHYDLAVADTDLDPENFRDLRSIAAYVEAARTVPVS